MRKALVVGIDYYEQIGSLFGCVNDAYGVKSVIERNSDGTINFDTKILTASGAQDALERGELRDEVEDLFKHDGEVAFFYFAGHGHIESTGGYLLTSESVRGDDGLALDELLTFANTSRARNRVIVLDSCHSGIAGSTKLQPRVSEITEGTTILTASTSDQYASENKGAGVFTSLLVDALSGAAGNLVGDVTPGSVYAHIDQSLGSWSQRPVFKTNVKSFVSLRKVQPPISVASLRELTNYFPTPGAHFQLDTSFEPEGPNPDPVNTAIFAILQSFARVNLVVPVDSPHMYHAAMENKSCKLTVLGEHYRRLVELNRI